MAAVQTLHTMTLARQQNATKMYNVIQHSPTAPPANCVIVSTTTLPQPTTIIKSVIQSKRPLAPAPDKNILMPTSIISDNNNSNEVLRCKRKINFVPYAGPGHQPASVARRNARERNRVKQVNNGFATLRQHIPASIAAALATPSSTSTNGRNASKKLSKVETLRMAVEYIRSLQQMLDEYETETPSSTNNSEVYYNGTSEHVLQQTPPPCSEASSSPTPSYSSESSVSATSSYAVTNLYHTENYENYDSASPGDEELLDVISWWQQQ